MTSTRTQSGPISPLALLHELADNWWLVLLRGIAAIALGRPGLLLARHCVGDARLSLGHLRDRRRRLGPGGGDCRSSHIPGGSVWIQSPAALSWHSSHI